MPETSFLKFASRPVAHGRLGRIVETHDRLRAEISADPLLDLKTVRTILGISYGTLNRLLVDGKLRYWQACRGSERKIRHSILSAYLKRGDEAQP